jgi:hypothetical protein
MKWNLTRTGEVTATIGYDANLTDSGAAWLRLHYTSAARAAGAKVDRDYRIQLETARPHYGGLRWWFRCPVTERRARGLYLPGEGGTIFRLPARVPPNLTVAASVSGGSGDRAVPGARKRLGVKDQNMLDIPYCPKPTWMRQTTYRRLVAVIEECRRMQLELHGAPVVKKLGVADDSADDFSASHRLIASNLLFILINLPACEHEHAL